jgi:hypothetical protein
VSWNDVIQTHATIYRVVPRFLDGSLSPGTAQTGPALGFVLAHCPLRPGPYAVIPLRLAGVGILQLFCSKLGANLIPVTMVTPRIGWRSGKLQPARYAGRMYRAAPRHWDSTELGALSAAPYDGGVLATGYRGLTCIRARHPRDTHTHPHTMFEPHGISKSLDSTGEEAR